jgi:glucose-1-phosphate thymidylyltransferase
MNIIIPMAGIGKRMRPFTLSVPKPLFPIAGKTIVQHLIEELIEIVGTNVDEIAFITGHFGSDIENDLLSIASKYNAKGRICYQNEALGTAHAIYCAREVMKGEIIVAYADTIFKKGNFTINSNTDGTIFVKEVIDPSSYGVVITEGNDRIIRFVEKPTDANISKMAIIGIYYFKSGEDIRNELEYIIQKDIKVSGEYQFTTALENLIQGGAAFNTGVIDEWMDCGNHQTTLETSNRILEMYFNKESGTFKNLSSSVFNLPYYVGPKSEIVGSIIDGHVSIGESCSIVNCILRNSIILNNVTLENRIIENSIIGNNVVCKGNKENLIIGDFSILNS